MENKSTHNVDELLKELASLRKRVYKIDSLETERNLYEKSLRFRNRLQKLITSLSSKFISIQPHQIDFWIEKTLRIIGTFAEAERCGVFQLYDDGKKMDLTHDWFEKNLGEIFDNATGINLPEHIYFNTEIQERNDIIIVSVKQLPDFAQKEKELLNSFGVKSILFIPLVVRGMLIGYIYLASVSHETIWTREIIMLLKVVGEIIVNALVRKRAEERLQQYHLIVTNSGEHMAIIDGNYIFRSVNRAYQKAFQKDEMELLGQNVSALYGKEKFENLMKENIDRCLAGEDVHYQDWFEFPDTGRIYMDVIYDPLKDPDDNIVGVVETSRDITKQKIAEDALVEAKERAEQADKLKTEFLAQISHEIRTPINSMLAFTSLLEEETGHIVDDDIKRSFNIVGKAGKRIIRTTDLILDMSEIQAGTVDLEIADTDIFEDILEEIFLEYSGMAKEKKLEFFVEPLADPVIVAIDQYTMKQVLKNIIHNALTYTFEGFVRISIKQDETNTIVAVSDSGIGISQDYLADIFEPFTQEDEGFTRQFEGNGLGLALAKKYCDLNRARIEIKTEKGKGSTFSVVMQNKK